MSKPLAGTRVRLMILAVVFAVAALLGAFGAERAEAFFGICTYYSDATKTVAVGARGTGCCGAVINWGIVTSFKTCGVVYCPDVVCPQTE